VFVTYTPEKGDRLEFTVYPLRMRSSEQEAIERASGMTFGAWTQAVQGGSSTARRVLLWVLLRREHKALRLDDVDFAWDELLVENSAEELAALRAELVSKGEDSRDLLTKLDGEIASAKSDPELVGKALLPIVA
jgi:hypothetical protein